MVVFVWVVQVLVVLLGWVYWSFVELNVFVNVSVEVKRNVDNALLIYTDGHQ
jgi:hypothetical protein